MNREKTGKAPHKMSFLVKTSWAFVLPHKYIQLEMYSIQFVIYTLILLPNNNWINPTRKVQPSKLPWWSKKWRKKYMEKWKKCLLFCLGFFLFFCDCLRLLLLFEEKPDFPFGSGHIGSLYGRPWYRWELLSA